jgi:hypothetical protein
MGLLIRAPAGSLKLHSRWLPPQLWSRSGPTQYFASWNTVGMLASSSRFEFVHV